MKQISEGEKFVMTNEQLLKPLEGKLVDVTLLGGEAVKARVVEVFENNSILKVVSNSTKE